jgi:peptide/nickel transport system permease protein
MPAFLLRRCANLAVTFLGITILTFVLTRMAPGDPVLLHAGGLSGRAISADALAEIRRAHGLDRPVPSQYLSWLRRSASLDFGMSISRREPVRSLIASRLPRTLLLNGVALIVALAFAIPIGIVSARRAGTSIDRAWGVVAFLLVAIPPFWLAIVLVQLFSIHYRWLPILPSIDPTAAQLAKELILPVISLALGQWAFYSRFLRGSLIDVMHEDYVRAARARGASEGTVLRRYEIRNALLPNLTILGLTIPALFSGSVIVERIFQWNGVGALYFDALLARDYPLIMALTTLGALVTLIANLVIDIAYAIADPRVVMGEVP